MKPFRCLNNYALFAIVLTSACSDGPPPKIAAPPVVAIENPAPAGSAQPGMTWGASDALYLSWQERRADSSVALRFAVLSGDGAWSPVHDVQTGQNITVSSTDVPTIHEQPGGRLVAVWRGSHDARGYDIVLAHSDDHGATWSAPHSPHRDNTNTEHGFTSWLQLGDTSSLVWVGARHHADAEKGAQNSQLTLATFDAKGEPQIESVLDDKICDCCHTSTALVPGGAVIVYRDRHEGEIRDISLLRNSHGKWNAPVSVHDDGWRISGCPVNGPTASASGADVAVAWFTAAHDSARVRVAYPSDTGNTFAKPIEINEGFPDGRVGIALMATGETVVSWIERRGAVAVLRLRTVQNNGLRSEISNVAELGEGKRAGGAPKLLASETSVVLAWTDAATNRVKLASISLHSIGMLIVPTR